MKFLVSFVIFWITLGFTWSVTNAKLYLGNGYSISYAFIIATLLAIICHPD